MSRFRLLIGYALISVGCGGSGDPPEFADAGQTSAEYRAMLADPDPAVRTRGAFGLSRTPDPAAVPDLADRLTDADAGVRQAAAVALTELGPDAADAVPALTTALADDEWAVRRQSALALGAIGPAAKSAVPALGKLDRDPSGLVRKAARNARQKLAGGG